MSKDKAEKEKPKEKSAAQKMREFREFINSITDEGLLKVAESLMSDMAQVEVMKEKITMLEDKFCEGDRAAFWFFTVGLDKDSIDLVTNTVKGRIEFLKNKEEREKRNKEIDEEKISDNAAVMQYLNIHKDVIEKTYGLSSEEVAAFAVDDGLSLQSREKYYRIYKNASVGDKLQIATAKLSNGKTSVACIQNKIWQQFSPEDFHYIKNITPAGTVFHLISEMISLTNSAPNVLSLRPYDNLLSSLDDKIKNAICSPKDLLAFSTYPSKPEEIEQMLKDKGIFQAPADVEKLFLEEVNKLIAPPVQVAVDPQAEETQVNV